MKINNKKLTFIIIGLAVFIIITGGIYWYWGKSNLLFLYRIIPSQDICGDNICSDVERFSKSCEKDCGGIIQFLPETVILDLGTKEGPVMYRASGFLFGISDTQPTDSFVKPVKSKLFRATHRDNTAPFAIYARAKKLGSKVQFVLGDGPIFGSWPGDNNDWSQWERWIEENVNQAKALGYTFEWDIWNEPDLNIFWARSQAQFFETWRRGVAKIRFLDPNAVIVGPSLSGFNETYLKDFLIYAKQNNALPNILSWHELTNAWNATIGGSAKMVGGSAEIPANVLAIGSFMVANGINIQKISLNEIIGEKDFLHPGRTARFLAAVERAKIDSAAHACWPDSETIAANVISIIEVSLSNCLNTSLDGILTWDITQPRAAWWVYKGYADITGSLIHVSPSANVDGVAGTDSVQKTAAVILGRDGGTGNVAVKFTNISRASYLSNDGKVRVVAEHIPYSGNSAVPNLTQTVNTDYALTNNSITVILPNFGPQDAYIIRLSPGLGAAKTMFKTPEKTESLQGQKQSKSGGANGAIEPLKNKIRNFFFKEN